MAGFHFGGRCLIPFQSILSVLFQGAQEMPSRAEGLAAACGHVPNFL